LTLYVTVRLFNLFWFYFIQQMINNFHYIKDGFKLICTAATGTNSSIDASMLTSSSKTINVAQDSEENKWLHYNEYIFIRP
jgi:hypothetical protein